MHLFVEQKHRFFFLLFLFNTLDWTALEQSDLNLKLVLPFQPGAELVALQQSAPTPILLWLFTTALVFRKAQNVLLQTVHTSIAHSSLQASFCSGGAEPMFPLELL